MSSLVKRLFKFFVNFWWVFVTNWVWIFHEFWICLLSGMCFANTFSQSDFSSHSLNIWVCRGNFSILMMFNLLMFFFYISCFWSQHVHFCQIKGHKDVLFFLLEVFYSFWLYISVYDPFCIKSCLWYKMFLAYLCPVFPVPFVQRLSLLYWIVWPCIWGVSLCFQNFL